jgi:hypothetical protein
MDTSQPALECMAAEDGSCLGGKPMWATQLDSTEDAKRRKGGATPFDRLQVSIDVEPTAPAEHEFFEVRMFSEGDGT